MRLHHFSYDFYQLCLILTIFTFFPISHDRVPRESCWTIEFADNFGSEFLYQTMGCISRLEQDAVNIFLNWRPA
jgi:hypothetical protein